MVSWLVFVAISDLIAETPPSPTFPDLSNYFGKYSIIINDRNDDDSNYENMFQVAICPQLTA